MRSLGGSVEEVVQRLGQREVLAMAQADVLGVRERHRKRRLVTLAMVVGMPTSFLWYRLAAGRPFNIFQLPHIGGDPLLWVPAVLFSLLLIVAILGPMIGNSRSPHVMYRPEQIEIGFDDVKGLGAVVDEVIRTLNVFLGYATFKNELGGNPRRGILFEGA